MVDPPPEVNRFSFADVSSRLIAPLLPGTAQDPGAARGGSTPMLATELAGKRRQFMKWLKRRGNPVQTRETDDLVSKETLSGQMLQDSYGFFDGAARHFQMIIDGVA